MKSPSTSFYHFQTRFQQNRCGVLFGLAATEFCNSFDLRGLTLTYGDLVVPYVDMHNLSKILTDFSSGQR